MKIIALLPVKNEAWILPTYLASVTQVADQIIALDDSSTDSSKEILEAAGVTVFDVPNTAGEMLNMSSRRKILLDKGRGHGGTHFIWLDADETFSSDFLPRAREIISQLKIGEKISMRWVHLWKSSTSYLNDAASPFGYLWKDFIVCDDPSYTFPNTLLSEPRTQGNLENVRKLPETEGVILHFQFVYWDQVQYKQAWYRCMELLTKKRSARRINATYRITLGDPKLITTEVPRIWNTSLPLPKKVYSSNSDWRKKEMLEWFNIYGIELFGPLQIWHLPALRDRFIKEVGKEPESKIFPKWIVKLNELKHKLLKIK